jgi:hypothetical protein
VFGQAVWHHTKKLVLFANDSHKNTEMAQPSHDMINVTHETTVINSLGTITENG